MTGKNEIGLQSFLLEDELGQEYFASQRDGQE